MKATIVGTSGSFDGDLHPGHLNLLKDCKQRGNVVVFLMDDSLIEQYKHRKPIYSQAERAANLLKSGLVDRVINFGPDEKSNQRLVVDAGLDMYCFGGDQTNWWNRELEDILRAQNVQVQKIPRYKPHKYSTSIIYHHH